MCKWTKIPCLAPEKQKLIKKLYEKRSRATLKLKLLKTEFS